MESEVGGRVEGPLRYPVDFSAPGFHLRMLDNTGKYRQFMRALRRRAYGTTVLDVGAGSGVLSLLAVEAGARHVVAVERPEVAGLTKAVLQAFPYHDSMIEVIEKDFLELEPHAAFGLGVCELVGYLGFEEGIAEALRHLQGFLLPGGSALPMAIGGVLRPVSADASAPVVAEDEEPLASGMALIAHGPRMSLLTQVEPPHRFVSQWAVRAPCSFRAIEVAVAAWLDVDIAVGSAVSSHWPRAVVPLGGVVTGTAGDVVDLALSVERSGAEYAGKVEVVVNQGRHIVREFGSTDLRHPPGWSGGTVRDVQQSLSRLVESLTTSPEQGARAYDQT